MFTHLSLLCLSTQYILCWKTYRYICVKFVVLHLSNLCSISLNIVPCIFQVKFPCPPLFHSFRNGNEFTVSVLYKDVLCIKKVLEMFSHVNIPFWLHLSLFVLLQPFRLTSIPVYDIGTQHLLLISHIYLLHGTTYYMIK